MKNFKIIFLFLCLNIVFATGCSDYLDIVPDNIVTVDDVFGSRLNADKFLKTCYGYLPPIVRPFHDPSWIASRGDEIWYDDGNWGQFPPIGYGDTPHGLAIMQGAQNASRPYINYWDGELGADRFLWRAIRECNIFLENVEQNNVVPDIREEERIWWIGEVKFLKAYYHFYLMHLYGPIPIIRENPVISASPDEVRVYREPIDDVVNYIVELIEEAEVSLTEAGSDKLMMDNNSYEYGGRITTSIAKAVKAKVLVWAASPLFSGNEFYTGFKDSRGRQLIPADPADPAIPVKWKRAADACKEAIDWIEAGQYHGLYGEAGSNSIPSGVSAETALKYKLRYAVTDPFNREIIWPSTHPTTGFSGRSIQENLWQMNLARESMPTFMPMGTGTHSGSIGTTLNMAEQFYTRNGLPIEDDMEWQEFIGGFSSRYNTRQVNDSVYHKYYLRRGAITAQLNFYREPRFYAYVGFDGGIWEGAGQSEAESFIVDRGSSLLNGGNVPTGYYMKKVVNPESYFGPSGSAYSVQSIPYSFPYMRVAELYLYYAEALNESVAEGSAPPADVYTYMNRIRTRAGLPTVEATWTQDACIRRNLHTTNTGMREIIRKERTVELCFEGKRGEDARRWRIAHTEFSKPIRGWNGPYQSTSEGYYRVTEYGTMFRPVYTMKDYLWPIKSSNIDVNNNLVQNPGW
jgi:hypothetical protein